MQKIEIIQAATIDQLKTRSNNFIKEKTRTVHQVQFSNKFHSKQYRMVILYTPNMDNLMEDLG